MRLSERALRRGLAPTAASDWRAADLPAALQGGARQAIFRGLYKGAEAAALRPGSLIALGRVAATLALAPGSRGARAWAARWPPTHAAGLFPGRWCPDPVRIRGNGSPPRWPIGRCDPWCWVGMPPAVQPVEWRRSRRGVGEQAARPPQQAWEGGQRGRGQAQDSVTYPKVNPKSPFRIPHAVQK